MMTCHCERIFILQSSSSFSKYKHAVHTSWLNGMEAKETGQKEHGELNPKCYYLNKISHSPNIPFSLCADDIYDRSIKTEGRIFETLVKYIST